MQSPYNQHLLLPKHIWFQIGLCLPALYRHNLCRTTRMFNPLTNGLFKHFRYLLRNDQVYQIIRKQELQVIQRSRLHFRVSPELYFATPLTLFLDFIESGEDWQSEVNTLYIRLGPCLPLVQFLMAIGILGVYKQARLFGYPNLTLICSRLFDNPCFLDDNIRLLRQFDYFFIFKVYDHITQMLDLYKTSHFKEAVYHIRQLLKESQ